MYSLIVLVFSTLMLSEIVKCQLQQEVCKYKTGERFYDFTPLGNASLDYVLQNERTNESIRFQLCHELKEECNGAAGYAACLMTNTNTSIGIGKFPPNIYYDDGGIIFKFIGDPCPTADRKYNLTVVMHCDYAEKDQPLALFPYQQGSCDFVILWKTKRACHPQLPKTVDCTINNTKGDLVDLTELKKVNENYEIAINNTSSIILNVCHSVIPGYRADCLESSGACFRNESSPNLKYANIGDVSGPKLENGTITLHYATGQICGKDADHSETTISFICDYKANNSHPVLNHTDGCNYKLLWKTVAACSKKDIYTYRSKTAEPCKIEDPSTKIVYDLETLKNQDYIVKGFEGIEYKFSVCRPLFNAKCSPGAGVCSSENLQTEGLANSNLTWSPRGPYLNYTNGPLCENGKRRNTTIVFICAAQPMGPMISVEDPCELEITFPTNLVCTRRSTLPNQQIEGNTTAPKNDSVVDVTPTITTTTQAAGAINGTSGTTAAPSPSITPKTNIPSTNSSGINESTVIDKSKSSESSAGSAGEMAKPSDDDGETSSHGGTIALVVILVIISLFGGVYLANPRRRELVFSYCTASCLRRSRTRMQYSEVNSVEETNLLLDAADTRCQSDSDDDLLRI